jgi:hypothetical protein
MKEPLPHYVLPWAGCAPWARANTPALAENKSANGKSTEIAHSIGRRPKEKKKYGCSSKSRSAIKN